MELIQTQQHEPMTYQEVVDATGLAINTVRTQASWPTGWFDKAGRGLVTYESVAAYIAKRKQRKQRTPKQDVPVRTRDEIIAGGDDSVTLAEAAALAGLAVGTIQTGASTGKFERAGRGRVTLESVDAYIAKRGKRKQRTPKQDEQPTPTPATPALASNSNRDDVTVTVDEPQPKQRRPRRSNDDNDDGKTGSLLETCAPNGCHPDPLTDADKARKSELIAMRTRLQMQAVRGEASWEEVKEEYDAIQAELHGITSQTAKWVKAMYAAHGRTTS